MNNKPTTKPLVVTGRFIQQSLAIGTLDEAYELARGGFPDITREQVEALRDGRAVLAGDTEQGIEYVEA